VSPAEKVALIAIAVLGGSAVGLLGAALLDRRTRTTPAPPPHPPRQFPAPSAPPALPVRLHVHDPDDLEIDGARHRHRELYDAEYQAQLDRLERLRRTIGAHLPTGAEPSNHRDEPDA
jgi:hypothetical protein